MYLDTVTYPDPQVVEYISTHFVPFRAMLDNREHWPLFRAHHIIWTPTIGFLDRNGGMHYHTAGFLPPSEFLSVLMIGKARCLMAWTRNVDAAAELEAAANANNAFSAEALWWLGTARFLQRRGTAGMWEAWDRLAALYPDSAWARRIYPRDE